jgi:hypothetical protein
MCALPPQTLFINLCTIFGSQIVVGNLTEVGAGGGQRAARRSRRRACAFLMCFSISSGVCL